MDYIYFEWRRIGKFQNKTKKTFLHSKTAANKNRNRGWEHSDEKNMNKLVLLSNTAS